VVKIAKRYPSFFGRQKSANQIIQNAKSDLQIGLLLGFPLVAVRRFAFFQAILGMNGARKKISKALMSSSKNEINLTNLMKLVLKHEKDLHLSSREKAFLRRFIGNLHYVDIFGVCWIDFGNSAESRRLQERLRRAFLTSGINNI
jgi:hypothetical protein